MALSKSPDIRELCYPFIFESKPTCDYEIMTDELCCQVGMVLAHLGDAWPSLREDLLHLQTLIYHLNGSVRGKNGIFDSDIDWLKQRYDSYQQAVSGRVSGFVLPQGPMPVPALHLCRCQAKKVVRMLVRLDEAGIKVPPTLPRFANLLANFFFVLTVVVKSDLNVQEVPYVSINYPAPRPS